MSELTNLYRVTETDDYDVTHSGIEVGDLVCITEGDDSPLVETGGIPSPYQYEGLWSMDLDSLEPVVDHESCFEPAWSDVVGENRFPTGTEVYINNSKNVVCFILGYTAEGLAITEDNLGRRDGVFIWGAYIDVRPVVRPKSKRTWSLTKEDWVYS